MITLLRTAILCITLLATMALAAYIIRGPYRVGSGFTSQSQGGYQIESPQRRTVNPPGGL
jgi:hypothetical protein